MSIPDIVRVCALFEALVSATLALLSLWYFTQREAPRLVVKHVTRVTITYLGFVAFGVAEITTHFGYGFRWELFAEMVIFALAANAHIPLVAYERAAVHAIKYERRTGDS